MVLTDAAPAGLHSQQAAALTAGELIPCSAVGLAAMNQSESLLVEPSTTAVLPAGTAELQSLQDTLVPPVVPGAPGGTADHGEGCIADANGSELIPEGDNMRGNLPLIPAISVGEPHDHEDVSTDVDMRCVTPAE